MLRAETGTRFFGSPVEAGLEGFFCCVKRVCFKAGCWVVDEAGVEGVAGVAEVVFDVGVGVVGVIFVVGALVELAGVAEVVELAVGVGLVGVVEAIFGCFCCCWSCPPSPGPGAGVFCGSAFRGGTTLFWGGASPLPKIESSS